MKNKFSKKRVYFSKKILYNDGKSGFVYKVGRDMRICPFWSTIEGNEQCFDECVMHKKLNNEEECIFIDCLDNKLTHLSIERLLEQVAIEVE